MYALSKKYKTGVPGTDWMKNHGGRYEFKEWGSKSLRLFPDKRVRAFINKNPFSNGVLAPPSIYGEKYRVF